MSDRTVTLTSEQVGLLISAMYEKTMETDRYLRGFDAPERPEQRHLCCDEHRLRYERDREMQASLKRRRAAETELIDLLEKPDES